jgi:predicted nuclease with TOPRIM domain
MDTLAGPERTPDMEVRVSRLEEQFGRIETLLTRMDGRLEKLDDRVRNVEIELSRVEGKVGQLPTTWAMLMSIVGSQIAFAGVLATIFKLAGTH